MGCEVTVNVPIKKWRLIFIPFFLAFLRLKMLISEFLEPLPAKHKRRFHLFPFPSFLLDYAHCTLLNFLDVIDLFAHRRVLVLQ